MSEASRIPEEDGAEPGIRERFAAALTKIGSLLSTRLEILAEEASQKASLLGRGLGSLALALVAGWIAVLLLAALLVTLFTLLFGHAWAGVLATFLLYAGAAAAAGLWGVKALSRVKPLDFPVTREELRKDWEALSSRHPEEPRASSALRPGERPESSSIDDVEARFRAGGQ